ncbi:MAG: protein-glutamate O-methyltransferase CheR [Epsilonproteobacteria bacterium]|nr:protein-glutamate O-methyltransferase CheR [Campylobacterota bacterium]
MDNYKPEVTLSIEEMQKLAEFLKKRIGIHLDEDKIRRFKKKIELLMLKHHITSFSSFYHRIRFAKDEVLLQDLINSVTVNETYFWREHQQFEILANEILPALAKQKKDIRILVAPTSSGEEVYSIMFAILEEGRVIEKANIEMVGIDIDSNMIRKAKVGLYTQRSVEKLPKYMREKYFKKVGTYYQIDDMFKQNAKFLQANIFDEELSQKLKTFDIVFSRNMLIYFDKKEKEKVFNLFYKILDPKGYLFLGHADANGIDKTMFKPIKSGFHIYQKI